jgi:hypothetical protein
MYNNRSNGGTHEAEARNERKIGGKGNNYSYKECRHKWLPGMASEKTIKAKHNDAVHEHGNTQELQYAIGASMSSST